MKGNKGFFPKHTQQQNDHLGTDMMICTDTLKFRSVPGGSWCAHIPEAPLLPGWTSDREACLATWDLNIKDWDALHKVPENFYQIPNISFSKIGLQICSCKGITYLIPINTKNLKDLILLCNWHLLYLNISFFCLHHKVPFSFALSSFEKCQFLTPAQNLSFFNFTT